jgi:hypothetical protein
MASLIVSARRCRTNLLHAGFTLALAATAAHAQEERHHHATVGTLHFPVNANAAVAREFDRGVALLHNFEYVDAVAAFRRAERVDPARGSRSGQAGDERAAAVPRLPEFRGGRARSRRG